MKQSMFIKIYIIPCLMISPLFTLSCNSWFSIWMSMEFNLMTFIPLLIFLNKFNKEISLKYFIVQTISSSIMLMSSNYMLMNMNMKIDSMKFMMLMMNLSILIKLGTPPFHFWFINLMKNMNWINCLILSTWQKIIPMLILMYIFNYKLMYLIIISCSITGAFMGLNHQSIRLILSYSSINHMSWMLLNMMISHMMWILYFMIYMITNTTIMMLFNKYKIFYINQLFFFNFITNNKIYLLLNFLTLTGLPPTLGFLMKWMSIYFSMWNKFIIIILLMIMMSILTFIFYMRISINFMMNFNLNNKILLINKFHNLNNMKLNNMLIMSLFMNLWIISLWMF